MSEHQSQHFAFVALSEPLEIPSSEGDDDHESQPSKHSTNTNTTNNDDLVALYQSYAERFPNPNLIQEYQDRNQLLQATSAAHTAGQYAKNAAQQQQQQQSKGLWGRLFGGGGESSNHSQTADQIRQLSQYSSEDDHDLLVYEDAPEPEGFTAALCGTQHASLDRNCIPPEAHSMARFTKASQRTRRERPHIVRSSPHLMDGNDTTLIIVGLGQIAEFGTAGLEQEQQPTTTTSTTITYTSDRDDLLRYAAYHNHNQMHDLSYCRATAIGPNFIVVSWGFQDGCVVFYRRIALPPNNEKSNNNTAWEAVVYLGPSPDVLEHSQEFLAEDDDGGGGGGSDVLRITDIVPLVVTTPGMPAASLAVSRLGGYLEVLPLPPNLWLGPILDPSRHKPRKQTKGRRNKNKYPPPHYAKPFFVNVASDQAPIPISALVTLDFHLDVLCLEAIRTRVTMETQWDQDLYGNAPPPAEYILVASGTQNGHEILTFWAISFQFAPEVPNDGSAGFVLNAVLQEALDVGPLGPDLSIFCNRAILDQWRQPRTVFLKEQPSPITPPFVDENENLSLGVGMNDTSRGDTPMDDDEKVSQSVYDRVTTITTSAPIVAIEAIVVPIVHDDNGFTTFVTMLSLLDWNGSVTIMDCSRLERMVSHSLTRDEYQQLRAADMAAGQEQEESPPPIILAHTLASRSRMLKWVKRGLDGASAGAGGIQNCVSAQWLARTDHPSDPCLALLTLSSEKIPGATVTLVSGLLSLDGMNHDVTLDHVPFPVTAASLQGCVSARLAPTGEQPPSTLLKVAFSSTAKPGRVCVCLLQPLQPRDIILLLAREKQYEKAVQAAKQLSAKEQQDSQVLEECRQRLWEETFDLQWLKQVDDSAYVINQAFALLDGSTGSAKDERGEEHNIENTGESSNDCLLSTMELDKCRDIYLLALQRTTKLRLASSVSLGQTCDEVKARLEDTVVRIGTFQLLCQTLGAEASFKKFRDFFASTSILDLAKSFASMGETAALSVLWFRHNAELQPFQLEVLSQLPMTLKMHNYLYLLPVLSNLHQKHGNDQSEVFLAAVPPCEGEMLRHISQLPTFLRQAVNVQVVLNNEDERMILARNIALRDRNPSIETQDDDVRTFYASRATDMQRFVGDLHDVADFCALGLVALGYSMDNVNDESIFKLSVERSTVTLSLFCMRGCALVLKRMLEEAIGHPPVLVGAEGMADLTSLACLTPLDLFSMELKDVVKIVLEGQDDAEMTSAIYNEHLVPLVKYLPDHNTESLDQAICDFCVSLARDDNTVDSSDYDPLAVLGSAAAIAVGSKTSIRKSNRIIGDKSTLFNLVLNTIEEVSKRCQGQEFGKVFDDEVVKLMWGMYESLPAKSAKIDCTEEDLSSWMTKADSLFQDLVLFDVLSQWPGVDGFSFLARRIQARDASNESLDDVLNNIGQDALISMCRSFCTQARAQKDCVGLSSLLRDLVSDIRQLFEFCYENNNSFQLVLNSTLSTELIAPLSRQAEFDLVAQFLTAADKSWWDPEHEARIIRSFVDTFFFSDGSRATGSSGDNSLKAAIACQDALGPIFPSLQQGFQLSRRYLDAAHFINSVIFAELKMPKQIQPNDLRGDLPLDVIESILKALPTAIIIDRKEWKEEPMAASANKVLREVQESTGREAEPPSPRNIPPLPGGAVFHLAGILGLEDFASVLVVKSRVVHYGVVSGLFGASAAVCRSILHDTNSFSSDADSVARMAAVAEIVTQEKYEDFPTKRELCVTAIGKFQTMTSIHNCKPFDAILETFTALEALTSLSQKKERQDILVTPPPSDAMAALHLDTWSQYSVNIYDLISTLQQHANTCTVDDSLLDALCKYVFFSCIFRSTRLRAEPAGKLEKATTNGMLVFGAALLLHIQNKVAFAVPTSKELRQILEKQTMAVINQHPSAFQDRLAKPDENIVRKLVDRGFTQMAARRSALATNNIGATQALQWGVANARDPRLNDPIVDVISPQRMFLEKPYIQQIIHTFTFSQQFLSGVKSVEEWRAEHPLTFNSTTVVLQTPAPTTAAPASAPMPKKAEPKLPTPVPAPPPAKSPVPPPKAAPKVSTVGSAKAPVYALVHSNDTSLKPPAAALKPPTAKPPAMSAASPAHIDPPPITPLPLAKPALPKATAVAIPKTAMPLPVPASLAPPEPHASTPAAKSLNINTNSLIKPAKAMLSTPTNRPITSLSDTSTVSSAGSDRSTLKERGLAVLSALRSTPESAEKSAEERRRLIEAGRRLLAKSRSQGHAPGPPPPIKALPPKATYTPYKPVSTPKAAPAATAVASHPTHQLVQTSKPAVVPPPPPAAAAAAVVAAKESYFFKNLSVAKTAPAVNPKPAPPALKVLTPGARPAAQLQSSRSTTSAPPPPPAPVLCQTGTSASMPLAETSENQAGRGDDNLDLDLSAGDNGDGRDFEEPSSVAPLLPPTVLPAPPTNLSSAVTGEGEGGWDDDDGLEGLDDDEPEPAADKNSNEIDDGWDDFGDDFDL